MGTPETWRLLAAMGRPRPVPFPSRRDPAQAGVVLFWLVDLLVVLVAILATFHSRVEEAVVHERSPSAESRPWVRLALPGEDHQPRFDVDSAQYQSLPPGTRVFVRSSRVLSQRVWFGGPALAPEAKSRAWGFWIPPLLLTAFLVYPSWICLGRPALYRRLLAHGDAAPGRLCAASLRELESGLAEALAEDPEEPPLAWVRLPVRFEFRDPAGRHHEGRFHGFNHQGGLVLASPEVTVLFDPRRPERNAVLEGLGLDLDSPLAG